MKILLVFLGGGLGAVCRFGVTRLFGYTGSGFPTGTFLSNAVSCFLLGILMGVLLIKSPDYKILLFLATGFCGGFSTFSTFSSESLELMQEGAWSVAFLYIFGSVLIGVLMIFIGIKCVSALI